MRESEAYLLEQGIEVVLKPFTIDQLEAAVKRALQLGEQQPPTPKSKGAGSRAKVETETKGGADAA